MVWDKITADIRAVWLAVLLAMMAFGARAETRIAMLGDSLTHGYGLVPEEGLVPQLQRWLDLRGAGITLINAGVSGDTTAGGLARIGWTLSPDIDALVIALGGNDVLRGIDPAVARANLAGMLDVAGAAGLPVLLVGIVAPPNYGPDYKTSFDAIYAELAGEHGAALMPDIFAPLREAGDAATVLMRYLQGDAIHPNAEGVELIVAEMGPLVLELGTKSP